MLVFWGSLYLVNLQKGSLYLAYTCVIIVDCVIIIFM